MAVRLMTFALVAELKVWTRLGLVLLDQLSVYTLFR